ncbi:MAG: hypothetical protein IAF38_02830 [Bacteroidia bacterium]|nr:hypothetical protein [Bacteroidia bacterium]
MKTIATYLAAFLLFLSLNTQAQGPGDSKEMSTKNSKGKHEIKREEKKARTEKRHMERLQRKSTNGFLMGGNKTGKEGRQSLRQKKQLKKREERAGANSQTNFQTKPAYKSLKKKHHRKKKNVEKVRK